MKLTPRERIIALVAIGLILPLTLYFLLSGYLSTDDSYADALREQRRKNRALRNLKLDSELAKARSDGYKTRSLPGNLDEARTAYHSWLLGAAEKRLNSARVRPSSEPRVHGSYYEFTYTVTGVANLKQLTEFLYNFYATDTLHRVRSMHIDPIKDSKNLKLAFVIEALSVEGIEQKPKTVGGEDGAPKIGKFSDKRLTFADKQIADYTRAITTRNIFGPANNAPKFNSISRKSVSTGSKLSVEIGATDQDPLDTLKITPDGKLPEGADFSDTKDGKSRLSWTPKETGEFKFAFKVTDDGLPPLDDRAELIVMVNKPKPPPPKRTTPRETKPKFDVARYALLSAIFQSADGQWQAWIDEKPTSKLHKKSVGESFSIGTIKGLVSQINRDELIFEADGKHWRVQLGESLASKQTVEE